MDYPSQTKLSSNYINILFTFTIYKVRDNVDFYLHESEAVLDHLALSNIKEQVKDKWLGR